MTACAIETATQHGGAEQGKDAERSGGLARADLPRAELTIAADGSYGARLARGGKAWFPERWTLDGPEPYAVPLPGSRPEEPDSEVLPLADGRVLIRRRAAERHLFTLLYPTGPSTGELPIGAVECAELTLLPPSPGGSVAYALAPGARSTAVWLVAGGAFGPEHITDVPGHCSAGVWLDHTGRMLALDRELDGCVKTVAVDLERGGEVTPLLQITDGSDDRLLLADPDSGLLLIRSNAPGQDRLGWGVLGSTLPVRFPECLRSADTDSAVTPFAVQPGQSLTPENCAVALRIDGDAGSWVGVWRPKERHLHQLAAPVGWLAGTGVWSRSGVLKLPYATGEMPCGLALVEAPELFAPGPAGPAGPAGAAGPAAAPGRVCKPVPLQQAPLAGAGGQQGQGWRTL
jgi:hypothetical protein